MSTLKKMKIKNLYKILLIQFILCSCHMHNPHDIINISEKVLKKNKLKLDSLIELSKCLGADSNVVHDIMTSSTTDFFSTLRICFDSIKNKKVILSTFDVSDENRRKIYKFLDGDDITDFKFLKSVYVSFPLDHCRDYNNNYAEIIYCFNKMEFKKTFPKYYYYEKGQEQNINDTTKWVYFYNTNWAITTVEKFFPICKNDSL